MKQDILDDLDKGIVHLLSKDGRMSFSEMAERLEVTEKTIRTRFKNLIDNDILKVTGVVNPISLGIKVVAISQMSVANTHLQEVREALVKHPAIRFVTMTSGEYQLLIQSFHSTYDELTEFIKELHMINHITKTNVIVQFEVYKNTFEYV
ncbi:Lrp/AsnC family transcriptional regulator [Pullulanibacillus sp. KACC 23026]|uniref:Lrp/AsnC family transcriptional regulator n=1 Tax=Pullulanibacillus sp. KACC 23026 TaxID=3028315 RepID=UPI0023B1D8A0|nr:Lrp/AsnC family transcriptional regulator [Pullulanibacillus sp. KACC 23026]WEG12907.1 Lrp/AsnC family transcriptional regulator [Pullulanibacillus sp. KACC 23026]